MATPDATNPAKSPSSGHHRRRRAWYSPVALAYGLARRPRLYISIIAAGLVFYLLPKGVELSFKLALTWIVGAMIYITSVFWLMATSPAVMRQRAARADESKFVFTSINLVAVASSFVAVALLIVDAKNATGLTKALFMAAGGLTIVSSWLIVQLVFTLHYAHEYYRLSDSGDGDARGLAFPGETQPDYWDFFYFAVSFGAAAQTSDVAITSRGLRRLATWHAIIAFVFNTTVLAMAINMAASIVL